MRTNRILCIGLSCLMLLSACGKINSHKDDDDKPKVEAKIENCQLEQYIDNFDDLVIKIQEEFNSTDLIITDSQDTTAYYKEQALSTLKHFGNGTWYLDVDGINVQVDCADKLAKRFRYNDGRMNHTVYVVDSQQESGIYYSPKDGQFVVKSSEEGSDIPDPKPRETLPEPTTTSEELSNWYIDDLSTDEIVELVLNLGNYEEPRQGETFDEFVGRINLENTHLIRIFSDYDSSIWFRFEEQTDETAKDRITKANVTLYYKREMDNSITKMNPPQCSISMQIYSYEKAVEIYNAFKSRFEQFDEIVEFKEDMAWGTGILIKEAYNSPQYLYQLHDSCQVGVVLENNEGNYFIRVWWTPLSKTIEEKATDYQEGCIFPNSSTEEISEEEIKKLTDEQLRYAINEIWARHGYIFSTPEILKYYRQFDWYEEKVPSSEWNKNGQNYYLNDIEKTNINRMTKERDSRGYQIGG